MIFKTFHLSIAILFMMFPGNFSFSEDVAPDTKEQVNTQKPILDRTVSPSDIPPKEASFKEIVLMQPDKTSNKKTDRRDANALYELLWNNRKRSLKNKRYVYVWADGVYFTPRGGHGKICMLVLIDALEDGTRRK